MFGINNYRKREKLKVDKEVQEYRSSLIETTEKLAIQCAKEQGEYEHTFHSQMEELGIEIAKLEARKDLLKNEEEKFKILLKEKDDEVERVNELCLELAKANNVTVNR